MVIVWATFLHLLIANATVWTNFTGFVASVLDGDTIEVLHNTHPERIRLNGIDCPEKGQVYDNNAKPTASELVYGNEVTLQPYGKDKYGRTLVDMLLGDGTNVNHTLVRSIEFPARRGLVFRGGAGSETAGAGHI